MARQKKSEAEQAFATALGNRIKIARLRTSEKADFQPMTQRQLASAADVDLTSIGLYERAEFVPGAYALKKLALALRVRVDWLLNGK